MNTKKIPQPKASASTVPKPSAEPAVPKASQTPQASDLGLTERRHIVRPLPVPDAVESDGDTDWATFQALVSDKPKT